MSMGIKMAQGGGSMPGMGSIRPVPQGNGYMGDPGFFGDLWSGVKRTVGGAIGGVLSGSPLGVITGAIGGALGQKGSVVTATPRLPPMMTMPISVALPQQNGFQTTGPTGIRIGGLGPGGAPPYAGLDYGPQQNGAQDPETQRAGRQSSAGYHWNKSGYFLKSGEWVKAGSRQVKNRRRNPLNPRALDRSISRITSAKRASSKLSRVTIRKKPCK